MPEIKDQLLDHDFDGIQEYNNPLPRWWLWLFYITILIAVVYFPYYHLFGGPSSQEEYEAEVQVVKAVHQESSAVIAETIPEVVPTTPEDIEAGKQIFATTCTPCHGQAGEGIIGPNLTDRYWLHGNKTEDLIKVITEGVQEKGMIAWKSILGPQKIRQVEAFVETLQGTNPPNPKAPQGQEYP
ncbi:cbb3-type cytochrome c oxidase N-terminal domain-containing protein [Deltaproteobacteria bacterium TL4]